MKTAAARIARKTVAGDRGCLVWTGSTGRGGHGRVWVDGRCDGTHRVAWMLAHGPIPNGLWVLHRCDNPPCVNVEHLFLGTRLDNLRDMDSKGRRYGRQAAR